MTSYFLIGDTEVKDPSGLKRNPRTEISYSVKSRLRLQFFTLLLSFVSPSVLHR